MDHVAKQLQYFASIDHAQRFVWQTEDPFVRAQEHETLKPLVERLRALRASVGRPLRVFESGCGEGVNMIHLRQLGLTENDAVFSGVDLSPEAVTEAGRHGLDVQVGNGLRASRSSRLHSTPRSVAMFFIIWRMTKIENDSSRNCIGLCGLGALSRRLNRIRSIP
jgi:hypothetical protein